jgi:hypothetical protein
VLVVVDSMMPVGFSDEPHPVAATATTATSAIRVMTIAVFFMPFLLAVRPTTL